MAAGSGPPPASSPPVHPAVAPLSYLLGRWKGEGEGDYPTINSFKYGEELLFSHSGKPVIAYSQKTWKLASGEPMHAESGYWRPKPDGSIEVVIAQSTGLVEVQKGSFDAEKKTVTLQSELVGNASKPFSINYPPRLPRSQGKTKQTQLFLFLFLFLFHFYLMIFDSTMRGCSSCSDDDMVIPSAQGTVTNVYRSRLSTKKEAAIKITWSKTRTGPTLAVSVNNKPIATYGMKGSYSCTYGIHDIGICWDFSAAKYNLGPEPVSDFYVAVIFDDEFGLLIGDRAREFVRRATDGRNPPVADFSLLSRTVQVVGRVIYSTRARFYGEGREHDIMIRFQGELELSMHVDERKVLHVRRLRWNFRGNETLFIDGLAVDVMWDLFQWLFQDPPGCAMVLLQTRAAPGSRWWLEEGLEEKDEAIMSRGFSLLIQVS